MNRNTLFLILNLLIATTAPLFGQLREHPDKSLKGVKGVRVIVNYQAPVIDSYGLTQKQLQDAVELRLKVDNIKVLTDKEWKHESGKPYFYITIEGTQVGSEKAPMFFYTIATDLIQEVLLSRIPSFKTEGSTWNQDYNLVLVKDELREVLLKIDEVAHDFAQSVHEANK